MTQNEINWPDALRATDSGEQAAAVRSLRELLQNGLRLALNGRGDVSEAHLEDFAQIWLKKNPWFAREVLPELRKQVKAALE